MDRCYGNAIVERRRQEIGGSGNREICWSKAVSIPGGILVLLKQSSSTADENNESDQVSLV